jgi:chaperone required for assembly of F1-ATPase
VSAPSAKRFYKDVGVAERPAGYTVTLDGREIRTPARAVLIVPTHKLADAIAEEWRRQDKQILLEAMPLTKFTYAAIDRVAPNRAAIVEQILCFGRTDLLCYRAPSPPELVQRQAESWDPMLQWARDHLGVDLCVGEGIAYVEQPREARERLEQLLSGRDDFCLAGLHGAVSLLGSIVLALALDEGAIDPERALSAARLDEIYQAEKWGEDAVVRVAASQSKADLDASATFLTLARVG